MAEANSVAADGICEESGPEGSPSEPVPPGATVSRVKLLDTMVDTFLQKLVAAGRGDGALAVRPSCPGAGFRQQTRAAVVLWTGDARPALIFILCDAYQRFTDCYKHFYQLQPEITQRIYDKFITQLQTSIREEVSEIKEEGNLEAVLNALDKIVEEGKARKEPAWRPSGIPEKDLHSTIAPYFLQQRDTLQRCVQKQEAENRQLADAILVGRKQVEELQLQIQARQEAWQALHREQRELLAVLKEPE